MARPRKHYGKWRIRWVDEHRGRHSETFDTFDEAVFAQQQHELEVKVETSATNCRAPIVETAVRR